MTTLDVFSTDPFSSITMTDAVNKTDFLPTLLGDMGIFEEVPIRTTKAFIESMDGVLTLIQTSDRGSPDAQRRRELRQGRDVPTSRIAQADTIMADEVQNIRAFGSETEFMQVQAEVSRRMNGPTGLIRNIELTWENMRLGAVQGIVFDADGSTINNWFTIWGVTPPTEVAFDLSNASPVGGSIRKQCAQIVRAMARAAKGAWLPSTRIVGLASDTFWDALVAHIEVRQTYLNQIQAAQLRGPTAWEQFDYGGITFVNYRGTDDTSSVAIPTDKVKFFPVGAPGMFKVAFAPAERIEFVNTPGQPLYSWITTDTEDNSFVRIKARSYPLFYCTRPAMLQSGRLGA
jgi:hypothetical protein